MDYPQYVQYMSTQHPGLLLILLDQSGSMAGKFGGNNSLRKDEQSAQAVNYVIQEAVEKCMSGEKIRNRFHISSLGYGYRNDVRNAFSGLLAQKKLVTPEELADNVLDILSIKQSLLGDDGEFIEEETEKPVWVLPLAGGNTPMGECFLEAFNICSQWASEHLQSFPPVILNITDGVPNNMELAMINAKKLTTISTNDGASLLFNIHISDGNAQKIVFPSSQNELPDDFASFLFNISSELPSSIIQQAQMEGFNVEKGARAFAYNADAETMIRVLKIGTETGLD